MNNSAAICIDNNGNEIIALGKGVGFGEFPRELPISQIERTFYNIDVKDQSIMRDLPPEIVIFSANIMDIVGNELSYQLSPNSVLLLADHIAFAIERIRRGLHLKMPLAYDVQQLYPQEYKIAKYTVLRIRKEFQVRLPDDEIAGIAMNLINAKVGAEKRTEQREAERFDDMLEEITEIVERDFRIMVNRESFDFSRYATHLQYLFRRLKSGKSIDSANKRLYEDIRKEFPQLAECVDHVGQHIRTEWETELTDEEKLYLMLHINRICVKEGL